MAQNKRTRSGKLDVLYPTADADSELSHLFRVVELKDHYILVTYEHSGCDSISDRETGTQFRHEAKGPDLGKALDLLVESTSRKTGRAFDMRHRAVIHKFLEDLAALGYKI